MLRTSTMQRWRLGIAVAGLVATTSLAGSSVARAQKSPTAQAAVTRAVQQLVSNRFADAAAEMETAVRFEPRFAFGWYLLASTSRRAGDPDRAAAAYRRYAELRPTDPDPYFGLGLSLDAVGDHVGALGALRRYAETDRRLTSTEFVAQARKRIAALEHDGRAPTTPPPSARAAEATRLLGSGKFAEAADFLRASVKLSPVDADAWYKLAFALRQAGQPAEAAKAYRRCITLKPEDADPQYGLGQVLVATGHPEQAVAAFRAYVKAGPDKTDARWVTKARKEIARLEATARASRVSATAAPAPASPASATVAPAGAHAAPATPTQTPLASARPSEPTPDAARTTPRD